MEITFIIIMVLILVAFFTIYLVNENLHDLEDEVDELKRKNKKEEK